MKQFKNSAASLILVALAGLVSSLAQAQVQDVRTAKLVADVVPVNANASLVVEFSSGAGASICGLVIDWGNGRKQELRVGFREAQNSPFTVTNVYPNPGTYTIKLVGAFVQRGLRSGAACNVAAAPVTIKVTDPVADKAAADQRAAQLAAEAAAREATARAEEAAARERAALADAERTKQDMARQQNAARDRELELKRKELELREAQLRRDEERRRSAPPAPAPAPAASAPAAPAPSSAPVRPPVKSADGF